MIEAVVLYTLLFEVGRFWLPAVLDAWRDEVAFWRTTNQPKGR